MSEPGWYKVRLIAEYQSAGTEPRFAYSSPILLARPDLRLVQKERSLDLDGRMLSSEKDLNDRFEALYKRKTENNLTAVLRQDRLPGTSAVADFVQLINLGDLSVEMDNWQILIIIPADTRDAVADLRYSFPDYNLRPGEGVRVWITSGDNEGPNLFWFYSSDIPNIKLPTDRRVYISIFNASGQLLGHW